MITQKVIDEINEVAETDRGKARLKSLLANYFWKTSPLYAEENDKILAIITDDPLVGVFGKIVKKQNIDTYPAYKVEIIYSIGPIERHQVKDNNVIYLNPFEVYEIL